MTRVLLLLCAASCVLGAAEPEIIYGTYVGGTRKEGASAIAVDARGEVVIVGSTPSEDFPVTAGAFRTKNHVRNDDHVGFVSRLRPNGSALRYSTLLGGNFRTVAHAVALGRDGEAYVVGSTCSINFPTTSDALIPKAPGSESADNCDGYLAVLGRDGAALQASTFFGGSSSDTVSALALGPADDVVVAGSTVSIDLPVTPGAPQSRAPAGANGFVAVVDREARALRFGTYLGGTGDEYVVAVRSGRDGWIYAAGTTDSPSFPGFRERVLGRPRETHPFIAWLDPLGKRPATVIRLGGSGADAAEAFDIDEEGDLYLAGTTSSSDFSVTTTGSPRLRGSNDGFVVKISAELFESDRDPVLWSRFVGGSEDENLSAISAGMTGFVFVGGRSGSRDFPISIDALRSSLDRANDAVLVQLHSQSGDLKYSTFIGAADAPSVSWMNDRVTGIAATDTGDVYVTGWSKSISHLVNAGAFQPSPRGNTEPIVVRLRFRLR